MSQTNRKNFASELKDFAVSDLLTVFVWINLFPSLSLVSVINSSGAGSSDQLSARKLGALNREINWPQDPFSGCNLGTNSSDFVDFVQLD